VTCAGPAGNTFLDVVMEGVVKNSILPWTTSAPDTRFLLRVQHRPKNYRW